MGGITMNNESNKSPENKSNAGNNKIEKHQENKNFKGAFWGVMAVSVALLVIAAFVLMNNRNQSDEKIAQMQQLNDQLNSGVSQRDSVINELVNTLNDIEKDLSTMREKEKMLAVQSEDPEFTEDMRKRILTDIQKLNTLLEDNKTKVKNLNRQLRNSGVKIAALEERIGMLEESVAQRDSSINALKMQLVDRDFMMAELNVTIDSLSGEVNKRESIITEKEAEMNKAYLVSGSFDELKEKGLLTKEGGFLGLGKSKAIPANLPEKYFSEVNIREMNKIEVNAKKAEIISEHPKDSYEIVSNDSLIAYIEIKKPDEFWKITRYAVVETDK